MQPVRVQPVCGEDTVKVFPSTERLPEFPPRRIELLPDLADVLEDAKEKKQIVSELFDMGARNPVIAMGEDSRVVVKAFLERLKGRTWRERLQIYLRCWWQKGDLVRTVQYVQDMADNSRSVRSPGEMSTREKWRLYEPVDVDDMCYIPQVAGLKMYQMYIVLYVIECRKQIQLEMRRPDYVPDGSVFESSNGQSILKVGADCAWAMRRITRPPPYEVSANEDWPLCRAVTYIESKRDEPEDTCFPIHPGWVASGVRRMDVISDDFFKFRSSDADLDEKTFGGKRIHAFWTESNVMAIYHDFCSCTLGVLRQQLDIARMIQSKLLGVLATVVIVSLNLIFNTYVSRA